MADSQLSVDEQVPARRDRGLPMVVAVLALGVAIAALAILVRDDDAPDSGVPPVTSELLEATLGATAQPFAPDRVCDVYVVPVDSESESVAKRLARALPSRVPVRACTTSSFRVDSAALDFRRGQLDGVVVTDQLSLAFQQARGVAPATVVGVTALDTYSSTFATDSFDFGVAKRFPQKQGFAVVSTARMESGEDRFSRLETMALRYVGLLYYGLPESSSTTSALGPAPRSLEELDLLEPQLSDPPPSNAELDASREAFLSQK